MSELHLLPNRPEVELFSNIEVNAKKGLPEIKEAAPATSVPAVIVGGGPSLNSTLESIRHMKACGAVVFALNNAARFLKENGIRADYQVMIDSRLENKDFVTERWAGEVLLASQCHPEVIQHCVDTGYPVRLWHPAVPDIEKHVGRDKPFAIWSGWTVGLTAMCVAHTLGHREMHLFGYDSCHSEQKSHAYGQPLNDSDQMTQVAVDGRIFNCSVTMAAQASHFEDVATMLADHDCVISVHGDGLIPYIANRMTTEAKVLTAVYDLGSSPPTFDFLPFLTEAEKARVEGGFHCLDVVFQPGPIGGFRHDNLPPSIPAREGMLHRICVSSCRLLPSVRNVAVLKKRTAIPGAIFPKEWAPSHPKSHYGVQYLKDGYRCLTASQSAKDEIKKRFPEKYATITLRQSDYWQERNSNMKAWFAAASYLHDYNIIPVFVPDTHGSVPAGLRAFDPAAWDIDLRLALYEGAVVNLGVANGPLALCMLSKAPYIMWKLIDETGNAPAHKAAFYEAHGVKVGDQFGDNGWLIWEDDTRESVIKGLHEWLNGKADMHEYEALAATA